MEDEGVDEGVDLQKKNEKKKPWRLLMEMHKQCISNS